VPGQSWIVGHMKNPKDRHTIEVRKREGAEGILTGANTVILIDGEPLKGCTRFQIDIKAQGLAVIQIEMLADFVLTAEIGDLRKKVKKLSTL
jgi:hypothetical protein